MRVLHVIPSLHPKTGGPPVIALSLAAAQAALGHETSVLSYEPPEVVEEIRRWAASLPGGNLPKLVYLPPITRIERWLAIDARRALPGMIRACDAVHVHGVWEPFLLASAHEARRAGKPYVVLLNGMLNPWTLARKRMKKSIAMTMGNRRMLDGAAAIQYGSEAERKLVEPIGIGAPGVVIPNGVFLEQVDARPPAGSFRRRHPEVGDDPFVLFLGRLDHKKGLDYLAGAFAELAGRRPGVRLVVAGPDYGAGEEFEREIARRGLSPRVHLTGPLYGPDKFAAMADAACFCLPSREEGFSVAILEAMACGTPVVISEACHFPDLRGAGRVVPTDPRLIAEAIRVFVDDAGLARTAGGAGRGLVEREYTWDTLAARTIDAYRRPEPGR